MTKAEWESLCDGCGRCCLVKLEEEDTGTIHYTDVACRLLDAQTCRCRDYENRTREVADCVALSPANIASLKWMPPTCAYRLLAEGKPLAAWHPLVSGRAESVIEAGISVKGRISGHEGAFSADQLIDRIRRWPGESRARKPAR
jgi:uncharacterized cysteine cluster protein YcgN (CxxCxxCC family)